MAVPDSINKLQQAVEQAMDGFQKAYFIPLQKETFLCSARCCDATDDMMKLQECTQRCAKGIQTAEKAIYSNMGEFQERLQRCMVRCQDAAQESLPAGRQPSQADISAAEAKMSECMESCGRDYLGKVPKLKADIEATLKKL